MRIGNLPVLIKAKLSPRRYALITIGAFVVCDGSLRSEIVPARLPPYRAVETQRPSKATAVFPPFKGAFPMKNHLLLSTLGLSVAIALSTASNANAFFGMLGGCGCEPSCGCASDCCEPSCGCADSCCEPSCGCADACCCDPCGCCKKKRCGLFARMKAKHAAKKCCCEPCCGCCEASCGCADSCCEPSCGCAG